MQSSAIYGMDGISFFFKYYGISGSTKNEFDSYLVTTICGKPRNLSLDQVTT